MKNPAALILVGLLYSVVFSLITYLRITQVPATILTFAGLALGYVLPMFLDALIPRLLDGSAKANKEFATDMLRAGAANVAAGNLYHDGQIGSPLRSYPLLLGYGIAAVYILTSSTNWFGRGVVLGLGLALVLDLVLSRKPADYLRRRWFSVFHTRLSDSELSVFVWVCLAFFGVLTLIGVLF